MPIILLLPITKLSYNISLHPLKELAEANILRQRLQRNNFATLVDFKTTRLVGLMIRIINKTIDANPYAGWL